MVLVSSLRLVDEDGQSAYCGTQGSAVEGVTQWHLKRACTANRAAVAERKERCVDRVLHEPLPVRRAAEHRQQRTRKRRNPLVRHRLSYSTDSPSVAALSEAEYSEYAVLLDRARDRRSTVICSVGQHCEAHCDRTAVG